MKDDHDVEKGLKEFEHQPDKRVKRAVMSAFEREFDGGGIRRGKVSIWKRSVPLYAVVAFVIVMMGLSYIAGKRSLNANDGPLVPNQLIQENNMATDEEITWTVAERDLL